LPHAFRLPRSMPGTIRHNDARTLVAKGLGCPSADDCSSRPSRSSRPGAAHRAHRVTRRCSTPRRARVGSTVCGPTEVCMYPCPGGRGRRPRRPAAATAGMRAGPARG
jgi:hypothetical protein